MTRLLFLPAPLAVLARARPSVRGPIRARAVPVAALAAMAALGAVALAVTPLTAQEEERREEVDTAAAPQQAPSPESVELPPPEAPPSPGGAFLRSVLLPGWGHAAIGSYTRGGFYFAVEGAALWMLVRTHRRLSAAKDARAFRERIVEARLRAQGIEDPDEIDDALAEDPLVQDARSLVSARDQQFEDWLALGIFLAFLGGADAFVSAHLKDFPPPVELGVRPVGDRIEVGVSVRVGGG